MSGELLDALNQVEHEVVEIGDDLQFPICSCLCHSHKQHSHFDFVADPRFARVGKNKREEEQRTKEQKGKGSVQVQDDTEPVVLVPSVRRVPVAIR